MPLYMVLERFHEGALEQVGARFRARGRMLPEGVEYIDSWMTPCGARCHQLMRAPSRAELDAWIECWRDLVSFEVDEVVSSSEYWATR